MPAAKKLFLRQNPPPAEPKPSPFTPLLVAVVFLAAALLALYYAGFFAPKPVKTEFVCRK